MRTTVDLPDDIRALAQSFSRDRAISLSAAVVELIRRGLAPAVTVRPIDPLTGFRFSRAVAR